MKRDRIQWNQGFTLLEVAIVISGVAVLAAVIFTNFRAITHDKKFSKAEADLNVLKGAVMSYWRSHRLVFPKDVHRSLASGEVSLTTDSLKDPWMTDSKNLTYGFVKALDPNIGEYFILYTHGPNKDTHPKLNPLSQIVEYSGSGVVVSNLPTKKIN